MIPFGWGQHGYTRRDQADRGLSGIDLPRIEPKTSSVLEMPPEAK
jgi:hypothetical protein